MMKPYYFLKSKYGINTWRTLPIDKTIIIDAIPTFPPKRKPIENATNSNKVLAFPILRPSFSRPTIIPSLGPAPRSPPTYIAVPSPINVIPVIKYSICIISVWACGIILMIKSAVKPIQNASNIVAIPGFCFNGIHSSSEISEVSIPAWP